MDLRSTVCGFAEKYFDCGKELKIQVALLESQNIELSEEISGLESTLKNELVERKQDFARISELEEKLSLCEQAYSNPTKIPVKSIKYIRNVWLGESLGWKPASIDVKLFITTNDNAIAQELRARKLVLNDLKDLDTLVPKIYNQAKSDYKYGYDNDYGFSEHWLYPYELVHARKNGAKGDCDDWAIKIVSWLRCAGVPADRVFVSCGTIKQGSFGHATVYVRRYSDDEWVHLNSTSPHTKKTSLQDFPHKDDESDWIGIHPDKFWFSFNDRIAISKFETQEAKDFFEKEKAMQNVVIE